MTWTAIEQASSKPARLLAQFLFRATYDAPMCLEAPKMQLPACMKRTCPPPGPSGLVCLNRPAGASSKTCRVVTKVSTTSHIPGAKPECKMQCFIASYVAQLSATNVHASNRSRTSDLSRHLSQPVCSRPTWKQPLLHACPKLKSVSSS